MLAIDKPNTYIIPFDGDKKRLFIPFRYKQDGRPDDIYDSRNDSNAIIETKTDTLIIGCGKTIIPDTVTSIGESAFSKCTALTNIIIPDSVTTISQKAFSDCTGASVLRLSDTVTTIDYSAFLNCSGITEIIIPKSVSNINNNAFVGCTGISRISVSSENETYDSRDNCNAVITTKTDTLMLGCKSTTIPTSVKIIGFYAFKDCRGLTDLVIPDNIEEIKSGAFTECTGLTSASISKSVTAIGRASFSGCNNLTSITVSEENTVYDSRGNCNAIVETETQATKQSMLISPAVLQIRPEKIVPNALKIQKMPRMPETRILARILLVNTAL